MFSQDDLIRSSHANFFPIPEDIFAVRKDSRVHMSDLLGYLLVASDPLLSSLGLQRRRRLSTPAGTASCSRRSWRCWQSPRPTQPRRQTPPPLPPTAAATGETAVTATTVAAAAIEASRVHCNAGTVYLESGTWIAYVSLRAIHLNQCVLLLSYFTEKAASAANF